jgi:hypothetical protein
VQLTFAFDSARLQSVVTSPAWVSAAIKAGEHAQEVKILSENSDTIFPWPESPAQRKEQ